MRLLHRALISVPFILLVLLTSKKASYYYSSYTGVPKSLESQKLNLSNSTSTRVETTIPGSELVPGFAVLDRLYFRNGTFFIVTANQSAFPLRRNMIAPGLDIGSGHDMEPTDKELRFIQPEHVEKVLGQNAIHIDGFSVVIYDTEQYMPHFYHWWGEIIFGFWRVYSEIFASFSTPPPHPARFILPFVHNTEWRDPAGINAPLMRAAFPSATIEIKDYWEDLATLNRSFVFDRAMIVSRETSTRHPLSNKWYKMIASTMSVNPAPDFFEHVRRTVITNLLGYLPILNVQGVASSATSGGDDNVQPHNMRPDFPVVTYISRQGGGWRRLTKEAHEGLIQALSDLEKEGVCRVNVVRLETMDIREQVAVVANSTILVGVHGNGLTHQIWMPPSSRSTVIEIFIPTGYTFDYEILARNVGHKHYAVWNDTLMTFPKGTYHESVNFPEGFQDSSIPVHGPSVAQVIRERLVGGSL